MAKADRFLFEMSRWVLKCLKSEDVPYLSKEVKLLLHVGAFLNCRIFSSQSCVEFVLLNWVLDHGWDRVRVSSLLSLLLDLLTHEFWPIHLVPFRVVLLTSDLGGLFLTLPTTSTMMDRLWCQPGAHSWTDRSGCWIMTQADITNPWWHSSHRALASFPSLLQKSLQQPLFLVDSGVWVACRYPPRPSELILLEKDQQSWNSVSLGRSTSECQRPTCVAKVDIPLTPCGCLIQTFFVVVVLFQLAYCRRTKDGFEILTGVPSNLCRQTGWPPAIVPRSLCLELYVHHLTWSSCQPCLKGCEVQSCSLPFNRVVKGPIQGHLIKGEPGPQTQVCLIG